MSKITGKISGYDRLRFRGTVRMLTNAAGLWLFCGSPDEGCSRISGRMRRNLAARRGREFLAAAEHVGRPRVRPTVRGACKEGMAREIQKRDGVKEGLICVLTAVEPCWSFNIKSHKWADGMGKLELVRAYRKCQHLNHYYQHPVLGFMHVRLQTWLPFNLWVCVNGREWLTRQMDAAEIGYLRRTNCFVWISDMERTQELLDQQVGFNWQEALGNWPRW
jgi:hypothetical protein